MFTDILGLFNLIQEVAIKHTAVAKFDFGDQFEFHPNNLYPLAFLETPFQITEGKSAETYQFALCIADRHPEDRLDEIKVYSKCKQIASEIKQKVEDLLQNEMLLGTYLTYKEEGDDNGIVVRMEFAITVNRMVRSCDGVFNPISL